MKVERIEIDSTVLGCDVLALHDLAPGDDLAAEEARFIAEFRPRYVSARIPLEDIVTVHRLESLGFRLIECQIRSRLSIKQEYAVGRFDYTYEQVTTEEVLAEVVAIAERTVVHDRFTIDPEMPAGISGERYRRYVQRSFASADEQVWRLYDPKAKQTMAFRTHRRTAGDEVLLLLGGVHPDYKSLGLGLVSSYYCFNQMRREGVRKATTHISAINRPVFDLEIAGLGFRPQAVFAVMRKVYSAGCGDLVPA
jgi:hypothetical protein